MTRGEEIRKAAREYAMAKSNEKNTWFVDYEDIEEEFFQTHILQQKKQIKIFVF